MKNFLSKNTLIFLILSLTLGLGPFTDEPHLWGKLKWVFGGAVGMPLTAWFDLAMHGAPWLLLLLSLLSKIKK